ncbi:MAG: SDR family oxidoreductase [Clostridia bacterium]|nr:SDR family oxidoreductase [Clostridia bacterium]
MEQQTKTVLITGGASGLGYLLGQCYAKEGANVVLADVNREALEACVEEIRAYHANLIGVQVDVRNYEQVCAARDSAVERFGSIDILINCAGGAEMRICKVSGEFHENPIEVYDFGLDLNLRGVIYFDHAVMAQMAKQNHGVIIHLGSITGEEGCSANISYAASKSALMHGVTKSIALAGEKHNVRSVCIAPGPVLTRPGMANMKTMLGRAAEPQEIVDMIMYAASDKCEFLNGVHILMDGGRSIMRNKG